MGSYPSTDTSGLKVCFFPISQPSRAVLMLVRAANIPHEGIKIDINKGDQKTPEYLAINPMGHVPTIVDDGFALSEGAAILAYLCESRGLTEWYPTDPHVRARINYWLHWNHTETRASTKKLLVPKLHGQEISEEDLKNFKASIACIEGALAKSKAADETKKFVANTTTPTIADLMLIPELDQLDADAFGLFDFTPYPHVVQWMADVKASVPSYEETAAPVKGLAAMLRK